MNMEGGGRTVHEDKGQALVNAQKHGGDMDTQNPSYEATGGAVRGFSLKVEYLTVWTQKGTKQPMLTCLKRECSVRKGGENKRSGSTCSFFTRDKH